MKGKLVSMMKRWWLVAFVFALALTLTSCSRKKTTNLQQAAALPCQGSIGDFDVWVVRSSAQAGMYQLIVIPVALSQPGDIASITIASSSSGEFRQVVNQVVLNNQSEVQAGNLTEYDLNLYDKLAITLYDGVNDFTNTSSEVDAVCDIPYPDGSNQTP